MTSTSHASQCAHHDHAGDSAIKDPVCGMTVDPASTHHYDLAESRYYFCSAGCLAKFKLNPDHYLNSPSDNPGIDSPRLGSLAEPAQGTIWTCPMHPEVRRDGPGSCPICGMALEPLEPTLEEGPNTELIDFTHRLWLSAILAIPLVILSMGAELFGWEVLPMRTSTLVQLALATPVVLWGAKPFFERGWASIVTRKLNMFTLISLGVGVAYALQRRRDAGARPISGIASDDGRHGSGLFRGGRGHHGAHFAWAGTRTACPLGHRQGDPRSAGACAENRAAGRATGATRIFPLEHVHVGDLLRIRPGEKVPVDGVVVEGRSSVDESMISRRAGPGREK